MYKPKHYPALFRDQTLRGGRAWLKFLDAENRKAFSYIGRMHAEHGKLGGKARAAAAKRDERGRFTKG